jgi:hypothetical protein
VIDSLPGNPWVSSVKYLGWAGLLEYVSSDGMIVRHHNSPRLIELLSMAIRPAPHSPITNQAAVAVLHEGKGAMAYCDEITDDNIGRSWRWWAILDIGACPECNLAFMPLKTTAGANLRGSVKDQMYDKAPKPSVRGLQ